MEDKPYLRYRFCVVTFQDFMRFAIIEDLIFYLISFLVVGFLFHKLMTFSIVIDLVK